MSRVSPILQDPMSPGSLLRKVLWTAPAISLLGSALSTSPSRAVAGSPPITPKGYVCVRTAKPPLIDGLLGEAAWRAASWTDDFLDIEGSGKPKPALRTRVKMLWDDVYLYVGAELQEPHVWGTLTKRDTVIFYDNDFEVFLDPDGDNHEYYEMEINALNTVWDLFLKRPYRDGGPPLDSWDIAGLKTAVHVRGTLNNPTDRDTGWTVECAMPWKALGEYARRPSPPAVGDQWRINFSRVEWRHETVAGQYRKIPNTREDNWVWSPQGVIDMHQPQMWGYLQFAGPKGKPGDFRPDRARSAKNVLHRIYDAQREFEKKHRRWAISLVELGLNGFGREGLANPPAMSLTSEGWLATATSLDPKGKKQTWFIKQDSRMWPER